MNIKERSQVIQMLAAADERGADYVTNLLIEKLKEDGEDWEAPKVPIEEYEDNQLYVMRQEHNKIGWIKKLREIAADKYRMSLGLKEAKDLADAYWESTPLDG